MDFGPYRLTRLLGRGGMAEVWRARPLDGGAAIAVKRILPHLCDELPVVELFLSEARLAARLTHPNLVRTFSAGLLDGRPYIAMELLDGVDLLGLVRASPGRLPVAFSLSVIRDLCRALAYVHSLTDDEGRPLGLIHRDISHSNVMVQRDGTVKLLDFGIAKAALLSRMSRTRTGDLKGKLGYLAPEVIGGGRYDHRADLFAVGVVLYELLVNRRLFDAADEGAVLWLNLHCEVAPPSTVNPALPPALDAIVLRALARDPAQRYADAAELGRDLDGVLAAQPWTAADTAALVRARIAPPAPERDDAVPARRRRRVALGAAAVATLAAALAWLVLARPPAATVPSASPFDPGDPWTTPAATLSSNELRVPLPTVEPVAAPPARARPEPPRPERPRAELRAADSADGAPVLRRGPTPSPRPKRRHANEVDMVVGQSGLLNPYRRK
jgi:serine/threonine-protein kinase